MSASPWTPSMSGLALFLTMLRLRLAFFVLAGSGLLVLQAANASVSSRVIAEAWALAASLLDLGAAWGLGRHLRFPKPHRGRGMAGFALATYVAALLVEAYALSVAGGLASAVTLAGLRFDLARLPRVAELVAFAALAPVCASHAALAGSLGAPDVERRARRALTHVLVVATATVPLALVFGSLGLEARLALAALLGVFAVVAFAKVLGATRYLLAFERTLDAPASEQPAELRAWHRA